MTVDSTMSTPSGEITVQPVATPNVEVVSESLSIPRVFKGYEPKLTESLVAELKNRSRLAAQRWQEQFQAASQLREQVGGLREQVKALTVERDRLKHAMENPYEAAGASAQTLVNAAKANAKDIHDKAVVEAKQLTDTARRESADLLAKANTKAGDILGEADQRAKQLRQDAQTVLDEANRQAATIREQADTMVKQRETEAAAREEKARRFETDALESVKTVRIQLMAAVKAIDERMRA